MKQRRRNRRLAEAVPAEWNDILQTNVPSLRWLPKTDRDWLDRWMQVFIPEKYWEGLDGLTISTEVQVTIAAQIGVVVLGFRNDYLDRLRSILVHPRSQALPRESRHHGVVTEQLSVVHGEALMGGPVRYVWPLVLHGSRHPGDGQNVVYHEIAHVLDMLDGFIDGTPPLKSASAYRNWETVLQAEYNRLTQAVEHGFPTFLDAYGATNRGEFFAVSTETFFECPHAFRRYHPEWFACLREFYRQDPSERIPQSAEMIE